MLPASSPPPADVAAALNAAQARSPALRLDLRWFPSLPSTMDAAGELARAGAPEGVVVVADEQTAGRGRRGRTWSSPPGAGLYLSIVFRPPVDPTGGRLLPLLTLAAGVAVRHAIRSASGLSAQLKWPNDVMAGTRKLAGILAEGLDIGLPSQTAIVGVGVNTRRVAADDDLRRRATTLEDETGRVVERAVVLEELLVALPAAYDGLRRGEADDMLRAWREASPSAVGTPVAWDAGGARRRGTTAGVDADGALLVRVAGRVERLVGGEVTWGG